MSTDATGPRPVDLEVQLAGGHRHQLTLPESSPILVELFRVLAEGPAAQGLVQLPLQDGRAACSFHPSQLVSVVTRPPVVIQLEGTRSAAGGAPLEPFEAPAEIEEARYAVLEGFLSPPEYRELLAWSLEQQESFRPGTTGESLRSGHRENLVLLDFGDASPWARLLQNRLLTWLPIVCEALGEPLFPIDRIESQLTAANEGQYYRMHADSDEGENNPRALSCVFYFHREPKGFSGGELRLYDTERVGGELRSSKAFRSIEPRPNRMVVFPSHAFHEVRPVKCPSGDFADSRFAITTWIRRRAEPDPEARFGWGHLRCGVVPPVFR